MSPSSRELVTHPTLPLLRVVDAHMAMMCMRIVVRRGIKVVRSHPFENFIALTGDYFAYRPGTIKSIADKVAAGVLPDGMTVGLLHSLSHQEFAEKWLFDEHARDQLGISDILMGLMNRSRTAFKQLINDSLHYLEAHFPATALFEESFGSLNHLAGLFELSSHEKIALCIAMLGDASRPFSDFLQSQSVSNRKEAIAVLGHAFGVDDNGFVRDMEPPSCLYEFGVFDRENHISDLTDVFKLSDSFARLLRSSHDSIDVMVKSFLREADPTGLTVADYPHMRTELQELVRLLAGAIANREPGIHVMLYGAPGTGKTEFARLIARVVNATLYEIDFRDLDGSSSRKEHRYGFLRVAQQFLSRSTGNVILFDEAEDVFPAGSRDPEQLGHGAQRSRGPVPEVSKAWLNRFLEVNPVPVIWISNDIDQIDPANLRRFTYHLEFTPPPRPVRKAIAQRYLADLPVSAGFAEALADFEQLVPAQLQAASRFARLAAPDSGPDAESLVLSQLYKSGRAMGATLLRGRRQSGTEYNPDYLNLNGHYSPQQIIEALRRIGLANLCFYGRSGTGKTQLAHHIAERLGRELIVKSASNLLSMWVGGTEKNIREMFAEAEDQRRPAVLLLDEADTLLRDRGGAEHSWEASQVNEFLHRMESFSGIFVCTTNLFKDLDVALLRRFTFKLEFLPMTAAQRLAMFRTEFPAALEGLPLDMLRPRLDGLDGLTPGDFSNVKRQVELLGLAFSASQILDMLEAEKKTRDGASHAGRSIGFLQH